LHTRKHGEAKHKDTQQKSVHAAVKNKKQAKRNDLRIPKVMIWGIYASYMLINTARLTNYL
jgi:hypothetical protein